MNGDVLKFTFPEEVVVNADGLVTLCTPSNPDDKIICGISGNDIQITFEEFAPRDPADPNDPTNYDQKFGWSMTNIANPGSVAPSEGFQDIRIIDPNNYIVSASALPQTPITNTIPA